MKPSVRHILIGAVWAAAVAWVWPSAAAADEWVVGAGHRTWAEPLERSLALDDSTVRGSVQPRQVRPGENILHAGPPNPSANGMTTVFGYVWSFRRGELYMNMDGYEVGWNPRLWSGGSATAAGNPALVDGVEDLSALFTEAPITGRPNPDDWYTVDLAIPVPVDSVAFFPPQRGLHPVLGQLYRDLFPRGYAVSRATVPTGWLISDEEPNDTGRSSSYHPLAEVVSQTFGNPRSVVGLAFPLRFTRFLRVYFGGVAQTFSVAEIKAFGRGFPAEARYVSVPIAVDQRRPVSYGSVRWHLSRFRLAADGSVVPDSLAPVRLELRTRTGLDDEPRVYHVFDELGRQQVVDKAAFLAATVARTQFQVGSAGSRGAITEDTEGWDPWSSPYQVSGEEIRSADARPYLQFRFQLLTDDPLAFGRLDSLSIEYSPLLAANVFGEVSVAGQGPAAAVAELPMGADTVLVYDLRAVFDSADQQGFDGVQLDVPAGMRFVGLEAGTPLAPVAPDSVIQVSPERLRLSFASHRITRTANVPLRVRLRGAVYQSSTYLTGTVLDSRGTRLPQTITPGDASAEVATNSVQLRSSQVRVQVLQAVDVHPAVLTPNGDGVNDLAAVGFALFGVEEAGVQVAVLDLAGREVARLPGGRPSAGVHAVSWDGRDGHGTVVPPGVYLVQVEVKVDRGTYRVVRPLTVAY